MMAECGDRDGFEEVRTFSLVVPFQEVEDLHEGFAHDEACARRLYPFLFFVVPSHKSIALGLGWLCLQ